METWIILCRPGFEAEAAAEVRRPGSIPAKAAARGDGRWSRRGGWAAVDIPPLTGGRSPWTALEAQRMVFARQAFLAFAEVEVETPDEWVTLAARAALDWRREQRLAKGFSSLFVEAPDSDPGRVLWPRCDALTASLEAALQKERLWFPAQPRLPRLHLLLTGEREGFLGVSDGRRSAPWPMGIPRLKLPASAPSRSARKLEEALIAFVPRAEWSKRLRPGMRAIDLGAAPGGWSWVLSRNGLLVEAVDNGPLAPEALENGLVTPVREDGFTFRPERTVDWMVCDMVTAPERAGRLASRWIARGLCRESIFNLKLPNRGRWEVLEKVRRMLYAAAESAGVRLEVAFKHLYHDREEVTGHFRVLGQAKKPKERPPKRKPLPPPTRRGRRPR